jgi:hypothetical protein
MHGQPIIKTLNYVQRHENVCGSIDNIPRILKLGTGWRCAGSLTPWSLYSFGETTPFPITVSIGYAVECPAELV